MRETTAKSLVSRSVFATKFETLQVMLSGLKVRGEISHKMANGGEFATYRTVV